MSELAPLAGCRLLGTNLLELPGSDSTNRRKQVRDEREQILNSIGPRHDENDAERERSDVLLLF